MADVIPSYLLDACCCVVATRYQSRYVTADAQQVGSDTNWTVYGRTGGNITGTVIGSTDVRGIVDGLLVTYAITGAPWSAISTPSYLDLIKWESTAVWSPATNPAYGDYAAKHLEQVRIVSEHGIDRVLYTRADETGEDYTYPSNSGIHAPETDLPLVMTTDAGLADYMVSDPFGAAIPSYPAGTPGHTWKGTQGKLIRRVTLQEIQP